MKLDQLTSRYIEDDIIQYLYIIIHYCINNKY